MTREHEIRLRLRAKGKDNVDELVAALRKMGKEGKQAAEMIERASKKASVGLRLIDNTTKAAKRSLNSFASRIPIVGEGLAAMGRGGLIAAGGLAAVALGLTAGLRVAREAVREFDRVAKSAREIGVSTDFFQAMNLAADEASIAWEKVSRALTTFERNAAKAATGRGEMVEMLRATHPELLEEITNLETAEDRLERYRIALLEAETAQERNLLATAAFGESGLTVARMLREQDESMGELIDRAREMGVVVDQSVLARAEEMETQLSVASRVIDTNLKQAFIDLAPFLVSTAEFMADVSGGLSDVTGEINRLLDSWKELAELTLPELEIQARRIETDLLLMGGDPYDIQATRTRFEGQGAILRQVDRLEEVRARIASFETARDGGQTAGSASATMERLAELTTAVAQAQEAARTPAERLAETIATLREARAQGVITTDEELDRLIAAAEAKGNEASATRLASQHAAQAAQIRAQLGDVTSLVAIEEARLNTLVSAGALTRQEASEALTRYRGELESSTEAAQRAAQITQSVITPAETYAEALAELDALLSQGAITQTVHTRAVEAALQVYQQSDPVMQTAQRVRDELGGAEARLARETELVNQAVQAGEITWQDGADYLKAYRDATAEATDANKQLRLENEYLDRVLSKQVQSWKDLGQVALDVLTDMIRQQIRLADASQGLGAFLSQILQGVAGSIGGGKPGPVKAAGAPTFHKGVGRITQGALTASHEVHRPLGASEAYAKVMKDERIMTAQDNLTLLTMVDQALARPVMASGVSASSNVIVRFADDRSRQGLQVREQQSSSGDVELDVLVRNLVNSQIGAGGLDQAMADRFGVRPVLNRR